MKRRPPSDAASSAAALAAAGRVGEAFHRLEQAIAAGDGLAAATLAEWRLSGEHVRRDLEQSRELFGRAAQLGVDEAEPIYIAMLANGAGGAERRWKDALARLRRRAPRDALARLQHSLVQKMKLDPAGNPLSAPTTEAISQAPRIERLRRFMTVEECAYVVRRAQPMLEPSARWIANSGCLVCSHGGMA